MLADEIDVSRGDMIVSAANAPEASRVGIRHAVLVRRAPLDRRRTYVLRHTTREVRARIETLDHLWNVSTQEEEPAPDALAMNDIGQATLLLAQPIVADRYRDNHATGSFILIDEATNGTVAAGLDSMSAAGPSQGAGPLGGAARSAVRGDHTSAAGPSQGANSALSGGSAAADLATEAASVGVL